MAKHQTTSQLIEAARRGQQSNQRGNSDNERKGWLDSVDYYTDEEKFFKSVVLTICRKEHKCPSDVELWCLPDIVLLYSSYIEEAEEIEKLNAEMGN